MRPLPMRQAAATEQQCNKVVANADHSITSHAIPNGAMRVGIHHHHRESVEEMLFKNSAMIG